jgi:hypothetical protein
LHFLFRLSFCIYLILRVEWLHFKVLLWKLKIRIILYWKVKLSLWTNRKYCFIHWDIISTDSEQIAFQDVDVAIFLGSVPRKDANHRKELLNGNVKVFQSQGIALDKFAKKTVKVNIDFISIFNLLKIIRLIRSLLLVIQQIQIVIFWLVMLHRFHVKILLV